MSIGDTFIGVCRVKEGLQMQLCIQHIHSCVN